MAKDFISFPDMQVPGAGFDMLGDSIRKAQGQDDKNKDVFKAVVLKSVSGMQLGATNTSNNVGAKDGKGNRQRGAVTRAYFVRILGDGPHSYLPDPCAQGSTGIAETPYNHLIQAMHTYAIDQSGQSLNTNDIVLVRLEKGDFGYDTDTGWIVGVVGAQEAGTLRAKIGFDCPRASSVLKERSAEKQFANVEGPTRPVSPSGPQPNGDPGNFSWSNKAKQLTVKWSSPTHPALNGTVLINGEMENTGLLVTDPDAPGIKLVPPAMDAFKKLNEAYKAKFPGKSLKGGGGGYRTYDSQVSVRMKRVAGDNKYPAGATLTGGKIQGFQYGVIGEGVGQASASGQFIGYAATPGRSSHGFGGTVDLDTAASGFKNKTTSAPEFQWLNKHASRFGFYMNVKGEVWHLNWADFTNHITGPQEVINVVKTYFKKKSWSEAGLSDPKNTFGPTEEEVTALASL